MGALRDTRKTLKARQILDGAKAAFLELGYGGASVDEIARRCGVSKGTLYAHFEDKARLFAAVVEDEANSTKSWLADLDGSFPRPAGTTPAEQAEGLVHDVADRYIRFLVTPLPQALYRIVLAEAGRFPELGRLFYEFGPRAGARHMGELFRSAAAAGLLRARDPERAARCLCSLCDGDLVMQYRLGLGVPPEEVIRDEVKTVVEEFLRIHGPDSAGLETNPARC